MAITHNLTLTFQRPGSDPISKLVTKSQDAETNLDLSVPDSSTDLQVAIEIDVSAMEFLYLVSDQNVTLETNSGSVPDDTLNLIAGEPVVWWNGSPLTNPLGTDVTALFFTNSSGAAANISLRCLQDPTP